LYKDVAIVIPIYRVNITDSELASLQQCLKVFENENIFIIHPNELDINFYKNIYGYRISFRGFHKNYFESIQGYNQLLLSTHLYKVFIQFKYILIYQLDAWVFRDDLIYWCNKNYDYIGAPWINWEWSSFYASHLTFTRRFAYRLGYRRFNLVGNGGLSLRKVDSFIQNLQWFQKSAKNFDKNEDYFFSFYITSYNPFFKVAPFKEALQFSFDENPREAYQLSNKQLPMGCHAWPKHLDFWKQFIPDNKAN
jgi:hypothetical protein